LITMRSDRALANTYPKLSISMATSRQPIDF
jgi:hypothetical protein